MRKNTGVFIHSLSVFLLVIFFSCTQSIGKIKPALACNIPSRISFRNDVLPIFRKNCSTAGCHSYPNPSVNLNLDDSTAYSNLLRKGRGYIDTLNPSASLLYSQMINSSLPMPPTGKLDDCTTSLILQWIGQKAKNN